MSHSKLVHRRCLIWQQDQSRKEGIQRSVGLLKKTCFQAYKPKRGKWTLLYTYKSRVIFFLQWRQRKYKPRTVSTGQEAKRKSQQRTEGETNERGKGKRSKKEKRKVKRQENEGVTKKENGWRKKKEREEKCSNFICLRDCKASKTPTPKEEAYLAQIGLGMKKLTFTSSMTEGEVHYDLC